MSRRPRAVAACLLAVLLAASAAAEGEPPQPPEGPALFLRDGTVVACLEAPVLAFGRAVYTTADGVRHSTALDLVDVAATRDHALRRGARRELPPVAVPKAPGTAERKAAPDFALERPDGAALKLSDLQGRVVLIDFWATWCGPCLRALPELMEVHRSYQDRDFQVVGVSLDSNRQAFDRFVREKGMDFPQYFDGKKWNNTVAGRYGVRSIPRTVLVDKQGRIAHVNVKGRALRAAIDQLLAEEG